MLFLGCEEESDKETVHLWTHHPNVFPQHAQLLLSCTFANQLVTVRDHPRGISLDWRIRNCLLRFLALPGEEVQIGGWALQVDLRQPRNADF